MKRVWTGIPSYEDAKIIEKCLVFQRMAGRRIVLRPAEKLRKSGGGSVRLIGGDWRIVCRIRIMLVEFRTFSSSRSSVSDYAHGCLL